MASDPRCEVHLFNGANCSREAVLMAWFHKGAMNVRLQVCREHARLSIGLKDRSPEEQARIIEAAMKEVYDHA